MAFENAKNYLANLGFADRIQIFETSSATVDLAAKAVGTEPARIAKHSEGYFFHFCSFCFIKGSYALPFVKH